MLTFRAILFATILFLSSCAQNAEMPKVEYAFVKNWADLV